MPEFCKSALDTIVLSFSLHMCKWMWVAFHGGSGMTLPYPQLLELSIQVDVPCAAQQGEFRIAVPEKEG